MRDIQKTEFYSKKVGNIAKGCQFCVKGEKLVLYITGVCPRHCYYCPLSEMRKDKDVIFANEWKVDEENQVLEEARLSGAKGAGITGGDPLARLERTVKYIKLFKKEFGKKFHIHLYTSFNLVNEENLKKLYDAGLDEIRFHPDFDKSKEWKKIELVQKFDWDKGVEIPVIPKEFRKIKKMIDFFEGKIDFLNLNEMEISGTNMDEMERRGFWTKFYESHGVKGSQELANKILKYAQSKKINVHYCTAKLKDRVQMQNRFKLRAKNVATKYDIITEEGLLFRGVIYLKELVPGTNFKEKLVKIDREEFISKLEKTKEMLINEELDVIVDEKKLRLITFPEHVEQFAKELKHLSLIPAYVEEDPTNEAFEVTREFL